MSDSHDGAAQPPAGWYPDPGGQTEWRWWSGSAWTQITSSTTQLTPPTTPDPTVLDAATGSPLPTRRDLAAVRRWWREQGRWKWVAAAVVALFVIMTSIGAAVDSSHDPAKHDERSSVEQTAAAAPKPGQKPTHEAAKPPDVRGLNLVDADAILAKHNYTSTIVEKDTAFGVYVRDNFVVCDQKKPKGRIVPLKVAKRGC